MVASCAGSWCVVLRTMMAQAQEAISKNLSDFYQTRRSSRTTKTDIRWKKTVKQLGRNLFDVTNELGLLKTLEVLEGKLRLEASTNTKIPVHTSRDFLRESCKT